MSTETSLTLLLSEKLFGVIIIIIGAIFSYISLTPPAGDITYFSNIFVFLGIVIIVAGFFLLISKGE